ncbi:MAG: TRAP transporter small permease [Limnohabitans sp.]|jgi:TRAP-type C4-dicarboxylate transport system permease small subunit|uniref:TRAP transporter small permease n=1 Tax=Limnohabitans sp. TaxID=1907725 RepID=UPI0011D72257|nr:MAG: TRAP transporter small permease [Limnohabitans sp.]
MRILSALANLCAILAGLLLTVITLLTCVSLIGRNTTGWTIAGDFELTGVATGAAIALFMPLCQLKRGHIIVDFFTAKASEGTNAFLDRVGALCVSAAFALMAWRTLLGGINAHNNFSGTMMLGFPEWTVYAAMVPPFLLCSLIALVQTFSSPVQGAQA